MIHSYDHFLDCELERHNDERGIGCEEQCCMSHSDYAELRRKAQDEAEHARAEAREFHRQYD